MTLFDFLLPEVLIELLLFLVEKQPKYREVYYYIKYNGSPLVNKKDKKNKDRVEAAP